jgi:hypothetical protein
VVGPQRSGVSVFARLQARFERYRLGKAFTLLRPIAAFDAVSAISRINVATPTRVRAFGPWSLSCITQWLVYT